VEDRPLDDATLIVQAQHGNLAAYEELVARYQDIAFRTAWLLVGEASEAEDVVQNALIKAHAALYRFRTERPFRPWLLAIVSNEARNRRRAAGRRLGLQLRLAEGRSSGDAVPSPEEAVLGWEQRARLFAAINALPENDRQAIALRYFLDLSEAEMADALGCARGTVKSRLSRALDRLRAAIGGDPEAWR
jgi:RNA polymerase sigma factor (sigma-70 family)